MFDIKSNYIRRYLNQISELYGDDLYLNVKSLSKNKLQSKPPKEITSIPLFLIGENLDKYDALYNEALNIESSNLLSKIIKAIDLEFNKDVFSYIINLKNDSSLTLKGPALLDQINLIKPKAIVVLGEAAGKTLLGVDKTLKTMRKEIHDYYGFPLFVTFHPMALIKDKTLKLEAWKDFKRVKLILNK